SQAAVVGHGRLDAAGLRVDQQGRHHVGDRVFDEQRLLAALEVDGLQGGRVAAAVVGHVERLAGRVDDDRLRGVRLDPEAEAGEWDHAPAPSRFTSSEPESAVSRVATRGLKSPSKRMRPKLPSFVKTTSD